jgi:hypothetical protein
MSMWNISTVMAPNLFFSRSRHSDCEELQLANTATHIIRLMLKYQKMLWKVTAGTAASPREGCKPHGQAAPLVGEETGEDGPRLLSSPQPQVTNTPPKPHLS